MQKYITFAEAWHLYPEETGAVADAKGAWCAQVTPPSGSEVQTPPPGTSIHLEGFAGSVELVVALNPKTGKPLYDKLLYRQKPGVAIVAWGRDAMGHIRLVWLTQDRPFAVDPDDPERDLVFGQIPMGFFKPQPGQSTKDAIMDGVRRELKEETGVREVQDIEIPEPKIMWQDPTFMQNGTYVAFAKVTLADVDEPEQGHADGERIRKVELLTIRDLLDCIRQGRTEDGVDYHMGLSLGPVMMFLAHHPEVLEEAYHR